MDIVSIGAALAIAKTIPNTALGDCTAAKEAAEEAAEAAEAAQEAAESAAAGVEYPVSYAEQTLTEAQKVQARANIGAGEASILDILGYQRFWSTDAEQTATYSNATFKWEPPYLTANGSTPSSGTGVRLCGTLVGKKQANVTAEDTADGFTIISGHTYRVVLRLVSGSYEKPAAQNAPFIYLYTEGTTDRRTSYYSSISDDLYVMDFAPTEDVSVWVSFGKNYTFSNAKWVITIQDTTSGAAMMPPFATELAEEDGDYMPVLAIRNGKPVMCWVTAPISGTGAT